MTQVSAGSPWSRRAVGAAGLLVVTAAAFAGGWFARDAAQTAELSRHGNAGLAQLREPTHRFARPLVECDLRRNSPQNLALLPFHDEVDRAVSRVIASGRATELALYFRELNDGLWFSSGEEHQFTPASLRKLPLMIALLKQAEQQRGFLDQLVTYQGSTDLAALQNVRPSQVLEAGKAYPVFELIRRMIVYSDNNAYALLMTVANEAILREVYSALGAGLDDTRLAPELRSITAYSGFFRVLFNGTYLPWDVSDRALALLAQAEFNQGLRAGVPASVPVAHKFAEHADVGVVEFHHCGVVYYPEHPYLLCVMSKGRALSELMQSVAGLSHLVYESIDRQHRPGSMAGATGGR